MNSDSVTLFIPAGRCGVDVVWKRYVLKNVTLETERCEDGDTAKLYIFYGKAKFYCGGKKVTPFKIDKGSAVSATVDESITDELLTKLPDGRVMRVCSAEHFIRGNLSVHHTRLALK